MIIFILCINIALVLGGATSLSDDPTEGGIVSSFFKFNTTSSEVSDLNEEFASASSPTVLTGSAKVKEGGFLGFLDPIAGITVVLGVIWDLATASMQLLYNPNLNLPIEFRLMFGLPLAVLNVFAIISFFRSGD